MPKRRRTGGGHVERLADAASVTGSSLSGDTPAARGVLVSLAERPDLERPVRRFTSAVWPEFMLNDAVANRLWDRLFEDFAAFQLVLLATDGEILAAAHSAPLVWDGTDAGLPDGWDVQLERSVEDLQSGSAPNTLGALLIVVDPGHKGTGLSGVMLEALRSLARACGHGALIACVRPTQKDRYPLIPIDTYARWTRPDGLPFDPWIRVHARAGARIVHGSPRSMTIEGSVAEWRTWTGLEFPGSGEYIVPGAEAPVVVDVDADRVVYHDPNVWMVHDLRS